MSGEGRLAAHLEVAALIRSVEGAGGFGTVIARGERDAGVILILTIERGENARVWERMPSLDGSRRYTVTHHQGTENKVNISEYLERRRARDRDLWIVELDVAAPERFIAS